MSDEQIKRGPGRPRKVQDEADDRTVTIRLEDLKELLAANKSGTDMEVMKEVIKAARERIPENITAPLVSDTNPLGERDHPRPRLKCPMYFGGTPIGSPRSSAELTAEEIESLNVVVPGHYRVRKTDGSTQVVEVEGRMNSGMELDLLRFKIPDGDETKNSYPGLAELARQCVPSNRVEVLAF